MILTFFPLSKHQNRYFKYLEKSLPFEASHLYYPNFNYSLEGFKLYKKLSFKEILGYKAKEIQNKYKNTLHQKLYLAYLALQVPFVTSAAYAKLSKERPKFLVVWNGKKFHQAIAVKVAKHLNIDVIYFENGFLPKTLAMDFAGVNASNSVPRQRAFYENYQPSSKVELPKQLQPRIAKKEKRQFDANLPSEYIFVPFQVAYDSQIVFHSPWIDSMFALHDILEEISTQCNIAFVLKEHPSDRTSNYTTLHAKQNSQLIFSSESTQKLIENATAVLTINSSVGMESLLLNKRVIVLGEAFYNIEGITKHAGSKEELLVILQTLDSWEFDQELVEKFLHYLYAEYLLPSRDEESLEQNLAGVQKRIEERLDGES